MVSRQDNEENMPYKLICDDCVNALKTLEDNSIDSIVTDPPYELGFMGKKWDSSGIAYNVELWQECLRVLKPGGHLLAFGGTRTYHRMTCAIEDAGFEIRDCIQWLYGSGFPKSHNISKAIDKKLGLEREVIGSYTVGGTAAKDGRQGRASVAAEGTDSIGKKRDLSITSSASDEAKQWDGWGTALKPANEPVVMARKPLIGTVADNVLEHGTGGLNIDATRIEGIINSGWSKSGSKAGKNTSMSGDNYARDPKPDNSIGRWPANVILDEEAGKILDQQAGQEVSRFFYCPKPSKKERNTGLENREAQTIAGKGNGLGRTCAICGASTLGSCSCPDRTFENKQAKNFHPTVKPISLMAYLIKLVTPPDGLILDPFMGSGTTGIAAATNGFNFIGIDMTPEYVEIAAARIEYYLNNNNNNNDNKQISIF